MSAVLPDRRSVRRPGLPAEIALRAALIKQMNGFRYEQLAFHLADSRTYLRFCGFTHPLEVPARSALAKGVEDGKKLRIEVVLTQPTGARLR